jgi:HJR/Mrr/RecB family endonuclease
MSPKLKGNSNLPYILIGGTFVLYLIVKLAIPQVTIWVQANWVLTIAILAIAVILSILGVILFFKNRSSALPVQKKVKAINKSASNAKSREQFEQWIMAKTPSDFEVYIRDLLIKRNFQAIQTSYSHDHGIDVIASKTDESLGIEHHYIIQCKLYGYNPVGRPVLQQLRGNMATTKPTPMGIIVCTSRLTRDAEDYAKENNIGFWGIDYLYERYIEEMKSLYYLQQPI